MNVLPGASPGPSRSHPGRRMAANRRERRRMSRQLRPGPTSAVIRASRPVERPRSLVAQGHCTGGQDSFCLRRWTAHLRQGHSDGWARGSRSGETKEFSSAAAICVVGAITATIAASAEAAAPEEFTITEDLNFDTGV